MPTQLSDFLPYLLYQSAELASRNFQKHYQERYGMLRNEWRVLFHLGQTGDLTAKQICERASLHKTKVSRAVKALETKRFIKRETREQDRRSEALLLTKRGKAVLAELSILAAEYDKSFVRLLGTEDHAALTGILHRFIAHHHVAPRQ